MPKYRVSLLLEKETKKGMEIIMEENTSYDDFANAEKLFVWLQNSNGLYKFKREENSYAEEKQQKLFNEKK